MTRRKILNALTAENAINYNTQKNMEYKIIIEEQAAAKLDFYVNATQSEISGMAKSRIDQEEETIYIVDFVIFKQECSGTSTVLDNAAQALFMAELMKRDEDLTEWNVWWHSHASMGVYFSTTDTSTISDYSNWKYLISLVANHKGELVGRIDSWTEDALGHVITYHYEVKDVEKEVAEDTVYLSCGTALKDLGEGNYEERNENEELKQACEDEVEDKVNEKVFNYSGYYKGVHADGTVFDKESQTWLPKDECEYDQDILGWKKKSQNEETEITEEDNDMVKKIMEDAQEKSGRSFNEEGFDLQGYTIEGLDITGMYYPEFDYFK